MYLVRFPEALPFSLNTVLHKFEGPVGTPKPAPRIQKLDILETSGPKELETVPSDVDFKLFQICATQGFGSQCLQKITVYVDDI